MTVIDESARRLPSPPLRPFVEWYAGFRQAGVAPARHRGLPSPALTFILTLDDPLVVAAHSDPRQPPEEYTTLLGGLHTSPALITHEGRQSGIQVALTPLGARVLLGLPAGQLANLDVDASAVLGRFARELRDRVGEQGTWAGRFGVLDSMLGERVAVAGSAACVRPEIGYAWRWLHAVSGAVRVSALAAETGWSERYLNTLFRAETGLSPGDGPVAEGGRARVPLHRRAPPDRRGCRLFGRWRGAVTRGPRRRMRVLRPGAPGPRVPGARRVPAYPVGRRGVPKHPSQCV
jgi:AraC-like DNA-binding protein